MKTASFLLACTFCINAIADDDPGRDFGRDGNEYQVTVLVSNQPGEAPATDAKLVNAWGITAGPTTPWWVANNGTGSSTLYAGDGVKQSLEVAVPGAPTGTVFYGGTQFDLAPNDPARFMFASEDGTISAWNPTFDRANAHIEITTANAIYKGLAIHGDRIFATNFGDACRVEAFDGTFAPVATAGGFMDRGIPSGFCPFGIQTIGDTIFVTYAKKEGTDDVAGRGNGFVRAFDADGRRIAEVGSRGLLNSPWGVAQAPANFGRFSNCLIVGNFGDGHVNAFCQHHGRYEFEGQLREDHRTLVIDGLWGIAFGNGAAAGPTDILYYTAGPDDEANGAFGKIEVGPRVCRR